MVVTFGEVMMRLATPGYLRFSTRRPVLEMTFGGGEANVAVSLANFGDDGRSSRACRRMTWRKPASMSCAGSASIREHIVRGGERDRDLLPGKRRVPARLDGHLRPRPFSAISEINPGELDWEKYPQGRRLVPLHRHHARALATRPRRSRCEARAAAKKHGADRELRPEFPQETLVDAKRPARSWAGLMEFVDICIANEEDAEKVFGIKARPEVTAGQDRPRPIRGCGAASSPNGSSSRRWPSRCARAFPPATTAGARCYYTGGKSHFSPPLRYPDRRPRGRRRFLRRRPDLRPAARATARRAPSISPWPRVASSTPSAAITTA